MSKGYEAGPVVTIRRSKHRVYIPQGMTIDALRTALEEIPDNADVDEIVQWTDDTHYIDFHHEKVVTE